MSPLIGMEALRAQLRQLPEALAREADAIVQAHADEARRDIQSAYPEGPTGNLKRGVTKSVDRSRFMSGAIVRSRAKHASLFEHGTRRRQTSTGANRGAMPQPQESQRFVPKAIRARARMTRALIDLVRRAGFEVQVS